MAGGVRLDFILPPGRWVDVDTLAETALQGLRDSGALAPRYAGLDALLATKREGATTGVTITASTPQSLAALPTPGDTVLDVRSPLLPRPGNSEMKRAWRGTLAASWAKRPYLETPVWADVAMPVTGSMIAPLEVILDALEPVLGRDPRGRDWQAFFPNDHLIDWLRVLRSGVEGGLRLRLGTLR